MIKHVMLLIFSVKNLFNLPDCEGTRNILMDMAFLSHNP